MSLINTGDAHRPTHKRHGGLGRVKGMGRRAAALTAVGAMALTGLLGAGQANALEGFGGSSPSTPSQGTGGGGPALVVWGYSTSPEGFAATTSLAQADSLATVGNINAFVDGIGLDSMVTTNPTGTDPSPATGGVGQHSLVGAPSLLKQALESATTACIARWDASSLASRGTNDCRLVAVGSGAWQDSGIWLDGGNLGSGQKLSAQDWQGGFDAVMGRVGTATFSSAYTKTEQYTEDSLSFNRGKNSIGDIERSISTTDVGFQVVVISAADITPLDYKVSYSTKAGNKTLPAGYTGRLTDQVSASADTANSATLRGTDSLAYQPDTGSLADGRTAGTITAQAFSAGFEGHVTASSNVGFTPSAGTLWPGSYLWRLSGVSDSDDNATPLTDVSDYSATGPEAFTVTPPTYTVDVSTVLDHATLTAGDTTSSLSDSVSVSAIDSDPALDYWSAANTQSLTASQILHYSGYKNGTTAYAPAVSAPKTIKLKSDGSKQKGATFSYKDLVTPTGKTMGSWLPGTTGGASPDYWVETVITLKDNPGTALSADVDSNPDGSLGAEDADVPYVPGTSSKDITDGVSADQMANETAVSHTVGQGVFQLTGADQLSVNGNRVKVSGVKIVNLTTGRDVTGDFTIGNPFADYSSADGAVTWVMAKQDDGAPVSDNMSSLLTAGDQYQVSLTVSVSHPDGEPVSDRAGWAENQPAPPDCPVKPDGPEGTTCPPKHSFPTYTYSPDKSWTAEAFVGGRLLMGSQVPASSLNEPGLSGLTDPQWSDAVGMDGQRLTNGQLVAAAVSRPLPAALAQVPSRITLTEDYSKADEIWDPTPDDGQAQLWAAESKGTSSNVKNYVDGKGEPVMADPVIGTSGDPDWQQTIMSQDSSLAATADGNGGVLVPSSLYELSRAGTKITAVIDPVKLSDWFKVQDPKGFPTGLQFGLKALQLTLGVPGAIDLESADSPSTLKELLAGKGAGTVSQADPSKAPSVAGALSATAQREVAAGNAAFLAKHGYTQDPDNQNSNLKVVPDNGLDECQAGGGASLSAADSFLNQGAAGLDSDDKATNTPALCVHVPKNPKAVDSDSRNGVQGDNDIQGVTVQTGDHVEYQLMVRGSGDKPAYPVTSESVTDTYDENFTPDQASVHVNSDGSSLSAGSGYALSWDTARHQLTLTFTTSGVAAITSRGTRYPQFTVVFDGKVKPDALAGADCPAKGQPAAPGNQVAGKTVVNSFTQQQDGNVIPSNQVSNPTGKPCPGKAVTDGKGVSVDGKAFQKGQSGWWHVTLTGRELQSPAHHTSQLGLIDPLPLDKVSVDPKAVSVSYSKSLPTGGDYGSDVSGLFGASIDSQGVLYDAAKLTDTYIPATGLTVKSTATTVTGAKVETFGRNDGQGGFPTGEKTLGAPVTYQPDIRPADLPVYLGVEAGGFDPLKTAAISSSLRDGYYTVNLPFTVTADHGSIINQGVEALNGAHSATNTVTNTVQPVTPKKDVVVNVGDPSADGSFLYVGHLALYRLQTSKSGSHLAYPVQTSLVLHDTLPKDYLRYTGQWAYYLDAPMSVGDTLIPAGTRIAGSMMPQGYPVAGKPVVFGTQTWDPVAGTLEFTASQALLDVYTAANKVDGGLQGSFYAQVEVIKTGRDIPNQYGQDQTFDHGGPSCVAGPRRTTSTSSSYKEKDGGTDYTFHKGIDSWDDGCSDGQTAWSNVVRVTVPELSPSLAVVKYDTENGDNQTSGDRDTPTQALNVAGDGDRTHITITATNGPTIMDHLNLSDLTLKGTAGTFVPSAFSVTRAPGDRQAAVKAYGVKDFSDLEFTGSLSITDGPISDYGEVVLLPGDSVSVSGLLTGIAPGQHHTDTATVTGKPLYPCATGGGSLDPGAKPDTGLKLCESTPLSASDPWNGYNQPQPPTALGHTGSSVLGIGVACLLALTLGAATSLLRAPKGTHAARKTFSLGRTR